MQSRMLTQCAFHMRTAASSSTTPCSPMHWSLGPWTPAQSGEHGVGGISWVERIADKQSKQAITFAMQQRSITTITFVSGQAQQILLGFVLGLSDAVAVWAGIIWAADKLAEGIALERCSEACIVFLATNTHL
jgi:hypothetical protein